MRHGWGLNQIVLDKSDEPWVGFRSKLIPQKCGEAFGGLNQNIFWQEWWGTGGVYIKQFLIRAIRHGGLNQNNSREVG